MSKEMNIEEAMIILKDFKSGKIEQDKLELYKGGYKLGYFYTKDIQEAIETVLADREKKDVSIATYKKLYDDLQKDFENYKNDRDINYLDRNHHKQLVEKSIGQIIDKPDECWFDAVEVKIVRNNILYGINIEKDFISLKEISDENPNECITVIAESPLSGAIYRYNNYGNKEWQLIGTMLGYA